LFVNVFSIARDNSSVHDAADSIAGLELDVVRLGPLDVLVKTEDRDLLADGLAIVTGLLLLLGGRVDLLGLRLWGRV
jgi:hypothetical protein